MKLRLWAFQRKKRTGCEVQPVPKANALFPFLFGDKFFHEKHFILDRSLRFETGCGFVTRTLTVKACYNEDLANDAFRMILPLRVYMPCYIHSSHPHSDFLCRAITYIMRPAHL